MEDSGRGLAQDFQDHIGLKVEKRMITAKKRRLKARWTLETGPMGHWIPDDVTEHLANCIREEIDREIVKSVFDRLEAEKIVVNEILEDKLFEI